MRTGTHDSTLACVNVWGYSYVHSFILAFIHAFIYIYVCMKMYVCEPTLSNVLLTIYTAGEKLMQRTGH